MDELFVSDHCPSCVVVEGVLRGRQPATLRVRNVDRDPAAREAFRATGVMATPALRIDGRMAVGAHAILAALRAKYPL
jgi:glutaredoxin